MNNFRKKIFITIVGLGVFFTPNFSYSMQDLEFLTKIDNFGDKEKVEFVKNNIETIKQQNYLKAIGEIINETTDNEIINYSNREKRIVTLDEEKLIAQIKVMPTYMYQYIGPYLHETPGISEKVLNMPGIKETKDTFPTRVAPHLIGFIKEYKQFLSPRLYFVLMPEVWPSKQTTPVEKQDTPPVKKLFVDMKLNNDLILEALKYLPDAYFNDDKIDINQLRSTSKITKDSKLTTGDAEAFISTMTKIRELEKNKAYNEKIYNAKKTIENNFDGKDPNIPISTIRNMINPCQRLVSAIKFADAQDEFEKTISKKGFTIDEWAYTCDKTIKAHRLAHAYPAVISFLRGYKRGYYTKLNMLQIESIRKTINSAQKMYFEMHQSSVEDVVAVRKLKNKISDEFVGKQNEYLFGYPITAIY